MLVQAVVSQGEPVTVSPSQVEIGLRANEAATQAVFAIYQARRPENTRRAQRAALGLFSAYMRTCGIATPDLFNEPWAWQGITWGLVQDFQGWQLEQGYSVKSVNDRVSVIKVYMGLANQAGIIPDGEILRLRSIKGFTRKEGIDADKARAAQGLDTRKGAKTAAAVLLTDDQARKLKTGQPDSPQGRRDALLMTLLLDHGLRVSEVAGLCVENIDRDAKMMTFYRQKTGRVSKHALRGRAWRLMAAYLVRDQKEASGPLLLASCKSGALLASAGMTVRAIHERVKDLGRAVGIENLSPHDCRHYGATKAGHDPEVSLAALMSWGDWQSPTSAARYIERGQADNDGVSLGLDDDFEQEK